MVEHHDVAVGGCGERHRAAAGALALRRVERDLRSPVPQRKDLRVRAVAAGKSLSGGMVLAIGDPGTVVLGAVVLDEVVVGAEVGVLVVPIGRCESLLSRSTATKAIAATATTQEPRHRGAPVALVAGDAAAGDGRGPDGEPAAMPSASSWSSSPRNFMSSSVIADSSQLSAQRGSPGQSCSSRCRPSSPSPGGGGFGEVLVVPQHHGGPLRRGSASRASASTAAVHDLTLERRRDRRGPLRRRGVAPIASRRPRPRTWFTTATRR